MSSITSALEAILFVASKPLSFSALAKTLEIDVVQVQEAVAFLQQKYDVAQSGIHITISGDEIQLTTAPEHTALVERYTAHEILSELTRAQLETLTVVAYQGPVTRPELEAIRGVNCAIILRNLEMRGLVVSEDSAEKIVPVYRLTVDALRYLGINAASELPEYAELHDHAHIMGATVEEE